MKICALRSSHFILGTYSILITDSSFFWVVATCLFTVSPFVNRFLFNVTLQSVSVLGLIDIVTGMLSSFGDIFIKNSVSFERLAIVQKRLWTVHQGPSTGDPAQKSIQSLLRISSSHETGRYPRDPIY